MIKVLATVELEGACLSVTDKQGQGHVYCLLSFFSESLEIPKEFPLLHCGFPILQSDRQSSNLCLSSNYMILRNITHLKMRVIKVAYEMGPELRSF